MGATVSPDRVLRELAELWVTLGGQEEGDNGAGVLRACSMTLVVVTAEADDPMDLGETLAALMPEHPARAIVVRVRADGERGLAARVFSQCWKPFGQRRQICCEQVEITASDTGLEDLRALVLPLCVPDLPVMLWCRDGRLPSHPQFSDLAAMASRVVVDSARMGDTAPALQRVAALVVAGTQLGDLAWTRLTRWRETLSRIFENRELQDRVGELKHAEIRFGGAAPSTAACYMAAWVADSLRAAGIEADVKMERDPDAAPGVLSSLHLRGESPETPQVMLQAKGGALTYQVNGLANCTSLPDANEDSLMREELGIVQPDPVFEKTLPSAAFFALSFVVD